MQRPWNKAHEVVYSLSTIDQAGTANMNICTYVVPISMKPKKYMIALYPSTKTYDNFMKSDFAVLQILSTDCKKYVNAFGKKSGHDKNKLARKKNEIEEYSGFSVLKNAAVYLSVKKSQYISVPDGDHDIFIVDVISWKYKNSQDDFLTTESIF